MAQRQLYLTQKIKNVAFNIRYNILAYFQEYKKNQFLKKGDKIFILGHSFQIENQDLKQASQRIYQIFNDTPWFTYRSGFPQLQGSYVSDTGWGCMVRVGQMLFAQIIKQHRNLNKQSMELLNLFNDCNNNKSSPLSIQNISRTALSFYNLKPGEWFNPSQISNVLSILYEKYCAKIDQLHFLVFNSGNIFFDQVLQKMFQQKIKIIKCKCQIAKKKLLCPKCFNKKPKSSISIIVLSRIGIDRPQEKYLTMLEKFMEFSQFRGVIGGKPKKALYFLGRHGTDYIYLDPHYVQNAKKQIQSISDSYFCQSFRMCKNTSIDSSLGICFYIKNVQSLNKFYQHISYLKENDRENMFIFTSDTTPEYMKPQLFQDKFGQIQDQDEDEFQKI